MLTAHAGAMELEDRELLELVETDEDDDAPLELEKGLELLDELKELEELENDDELLEDGMTGA